MSSPERTFTSPSGRSWTASILELPRVLAGEPPQQVLRFASGEVALDLPDWPGEWHTLDDRQLVELARRATPPHLGLPIPQRRY